MIVTDTESATLDRPYISVSTFKNKFQWQIPDLNDKFRIVICNNYFFYFLGKKVFIGKNVTSSKHTEYNKVLLKV